jgi:cobalamin biosynthesis Co2+ chelatase CbiK
MINKDSDCNIYDRSDKYRVRSAALELGGRFTTRDIVRVLRNRGARQVPPPRAVANYLRKEGYAQKVAYKNNQTIWELKGVEA